MSPKRRSEQKIPGIIILVALIGAALALGIYGLQLAKPYMNTNTTTTTLTTSIASNTSAPQSESTTPTPLTEETSSTNSSSTT